MNTNGVLKLALEALVSTYQGKDKTGQVTEAIIALREALAEQMTTTENNGGKTGWPPGLLQDDCKGLSKWLANKPDAKRRVREALAEQPAYRAVKTFHEGKPVYVAEQPAQPAVPDAIGPNEDELPAYAAGWNDCRQLMLEMRKP